MTNSTMTGHLAMLHTVTAVEPRPMTLPTASASGPVTTTASAAITMRISMSSVTSICSGRSFQIGRASTVS